MLPKAAGSLLARAGATASEALFGSATLGAAASAAPRSAARGLMTTVHSPGDGRTRTVTLIPGDGVGPEITNVVTKVVGALGAPIVWERFDSLSGSVGGKTATDVPKDVIESIKRNGVCLKGTLFTHINSYKFTDSQSLNVQLRKQLDMHVNLVHGFSIPGVPSRFQNLDIVVIRENTEGEYSGLEHETVEGVVESLKIITYEKSLRTAQYAFEYAQLNNREKVTAVHKANIMKLGDGMFLKAVREVAKNFPNVKFEEMIVDNTCMQLVSNPHQFDVMVTPNLYGNLAANIVAGLCGGHGVVPGANVGNGIGIFEQGARKTAVDLAGTGKANPTALLLATSMMMHHMGLHKYSDRLEQAILKVYTDPDSKKLVTPDVGGTGTTVSFADAVMKRMSA
uniref:Isopropylmalate dehydrogenase-like domain-containing protein n=1 Tax=Chlamydomonas euryale TaxID=1486919 RepID=A0A6U2F8Z1_9CHLO